MEFDSASRTFIRRDFTTPKLKLGEVLIRVTCCTICGSDLHTFSGRRAAPESCVLGHEIIGEVVDWAGDDPRLDFNGNQLHVGQRVTWVMAFGCGSCFFCRNDLNQKCESLFKYGHEPAVCDRPTGGLSEFCVLVPGTPVFRLPDILSDEAACPANCATATVFAAARLIEQTHVLRGSVFLVVGAGMLGLTAVAHLSDSGARSIIVADSNEQRLTIAREFGATHCLCSDQQDEICSAVSSLSEGRGADIALDFAGATSAVQTCLASVRVGGCVLLAGSVFPSGKIQMTPETIVRRMLTIRGLHNYLPSDLDNALGFLQRVGERFQFSDLVARSFQLTDAGLAFEYAQKHRPVRVAVKPPSRKDLLPFDLCSSQRTNLAGCCTSRGSRQNRSDH